MNDMMASCVARLECENDELRQDIEGYRQRLMDTQHQLEKMKKEAAKEYQQKVESLEKETKQLRKRTSMELSKEFQQKMADVDKKNEDLKRKMTLTVQQRLNVIQKENNDLKKQIQIMQDMWGKDKEQYARLEKLNKDLTSEKEHFKQTISRIQQSSEGKIHQLEMEVDDLQKRAMTLKKHNDRVKNLCDNEINKDNAKYVVSEAVRDVERSQRKMRGSSSSAFVQTPEVERMHAETQSQSVGVVQGSSRSITPVRGVVAPQRRSLGSESPDYSEQTTPFARGDRTRRSIVPMRNSLPFSRDNRMRQSMPEKKMVFVAPERRNATPSGGKSRSSYNPPMRNSSPVSMCETNKLSQSFDGQKLKEYSSDKDSGHATSPDSPTSEHIPNGIPNGKESNKIAHFITSFQMVSNETVKTRIKTTSHQSVPKMSEKWKVFVDKIIELQDKNQQLMVQNSELRKTINSVKFNVERIDRLEKMNVDLEVENKKLRKICEMLQSTNNPYDPRTYHFYSNV